MKTFVFLPVNHTGTPTDDDLVIIHAMNLEAANHKLEEMGLKPQDWRLN